MLFACLLVAVLTGFALAPAGASAQYRHVLVTAQFGPDGTNGTSFTTVNTLAYQQATHHLYVLDAGGGIFGFDRSAPGTFTPLGGAFPISLPNFGLDSDLAVDNSGDGTAGSLYLTRDSEHIESFSASGAPLPTVYAGEGEVCGVAVDSAGHIWGGRYGKSDAASFNPGVPTVARTVDLSNGAESPCKLTVDQSNNDLYVSSWAEAGVWQYTAASNYVTKKRIAGGRNNRVTVDGARHIVYVAQPSAAEILAYSTMTGELLEAIESPAGQVRGLAVDEATGTLFVSAGASNKVMEMPGTDVPRVVTGAPTGDESVSGTVDPEATGPVTECYFEYGPSQAYGSKQNCTQSLPIGSATTVGATLPGLSKETTYHYRLVVGNSTVGVPIKGADHTITSHYVRRLITEAPQAVGRSTAQMNASFEGTGKETTYYFEYGTGLGYGSRYPVGSGEEVVAPTTGRVTISAPLTGLAPGTTYHYRVVAKNSEGVSHGEDVEFKSVPPGIPAIKDVQADGISPTAALIAASVNPEAAIASYSVEYGTTPRLGTTTQPRALPGDENDHPVSIPLERLTPGTVYYYRVVANNSSGESVGPDLTFTTPDLPLIASSEASAGTDSARLTVSVLSNARPTDVRIEWGPTTSYGSSSAVVRLPGSLEAQPVSVDVGSLKPGTTYHFRGTATNEIGETVDVDHTFTTLAAPVATEPLTTTKPKPCKRGFVKKKGRCVRAHGKHKKKHGKRRRGKSGAKR